MTTHYKDNTYKTATAVSHDAQNHTVTTKDDYGNIMSIVHYRGVMPQKVKQDLARDNFVKVNDLF